MQFIYLHYTELRSSLRHVLCIKIKLEFMVSVFVEGGELENLEKNSLRKYNSRHQTQPTYDAGPELNPVHIGAR